MALLNGIATKLKGSAGSLTFRQSSNRTVVSEKTTEVKNTRTAAQQKHRMKWANIVQMYKGISPLLNCAFENKAQGVTDYNMFVKINMQLSPVYLTKAEVTGGACVVAPYQITQGSLPAIEVTGEDSDRTTNISLGSLTISETTTVAEFSNAVVQNNEPFDYGEQISFYDIRQRVNAATSIPYGNFKASSVVLDKENNALLLATVNSLGFQSKSGYLGSGTIEDDGAFCWVHSSNKNGTTKVSTQVLLIHNSLLESYTSQDAYDNAVETYGGESDVFLNPNGARNTTSGTQQYTLTVTVNDSDMGSVSPTSTKVSKGTNVLVTATNEIGYHFYQWSDGSTENPRTVTVNSDMTLQAEFKLGEADGV